MQRLEMFVRKLAIPDLAGRALHLTHCKWAVCGLPRFSAIFATNRSTEFRLLTRAT
jgi:hypothetical protein